MTLFCETVNVDKNCLFVKCSKNKVIFQLGVDKTTSTLLLLHFTRVASKLSLLTIQALAASLTVNLQP
jgi:hypothetical protein